MSFYKSKFQKTTAQVMLGSAVLIGHTFAYGALEEIIVTAQKRSESLQDVPVAVSAFTGDTMKTLGVTNASDLVDLTPGFASCNTTGIKPKLLFARRWNQRRSYYSLHLLLVSTLMV
jgi:iron complex outermembrane receptor protein